MWVKFKQKLEDKKTQKDCPNPNVHCLLRTRKQGEAEGKRQEARTERKEPRAKLKKDKKGKETRGSGTLLVPPKGTGLIRRGPDNLSKGKGERWGERRGESRRKGGDAW